MEEEIFKVYKDTRSNNDHSFNGALWEVSNYGNVRKNGDIYIPFDRGNGYLFFCCDQSKCYVHRAVAELFIPNPYHKPTVDHLNRIRTDNRASNLRWATMKEQAENMDWKSIRVKMSASQKGKKRSEETKEKIRAAKLGNKNTLGLFWVFNPTTDHSARIDPSELNDYLEKGYVRGRKSVGAIGTIWVFNPTTDHSARIDPSELNDYLEKGYVKGNKGKGTLGKVWVTNPTTEHRTLVNPSQLPKYLDKGYVKGQKIKK